MNHKLKVLVRLDLSDTSAVMAVTGCLTIDSVQALLPIVRRTRSLAGGVSVRIDLQDAMHIDPEAIEVLQSHIQAHTTTQDPHAVSMHCPDEFPVCPRLVQSDRPELVVA
ncbi:hypothetical protein GCM10027403_03010 [Arthrobacter tecti]